MPEAMKRIRKDLGKDAVILNSKVIHTGGFLGLFRKKNIEVIAALDKESNQFKIKELETDKETIPFLENEQVIETVGKEEVKKSKISSNNRSDTIILKEIEDLKILINQLPIDGKLLDEHIPSPYQKLYNKLRKNNVSLDLLNDINTKVLEHYYYHRRRVNEEEANDFIYQVLVNYIKKLPFGGFTPQKKYITVIGPTGVGKTTTLAKIASYTMIEKRKKIGFITTDTYRIAAVEQLKTYAKILNAPIEVCYNLHDFKFALEKFNEFDHIFIDTAGRNFKNSKYVEELKDTIEFSEDNMESYLVFSLTAKEKDLEIIYNQFSNFPIDKLIFTKLDETSQYGSLINLPYKFQKPISYITYGQDVPDDIIEATHEFVINQFVERGIK